MVPQPEACLNETKIYRICSSSYDTKMLEQIHSQAQVLEWEIKTVEREVTVEETGVF